MPSIHLWFKALPQGIPYESLGKKAKSTLKGKAYGGTGEISLIITIANASSIISTHRQLAVLLNIYWWARILI